MNTMNRCLRDFSIFSRPTRGLGRLTLLAVLSGPFWAQAQDLNSPVTPGYTGRQFPARAQRAVLMVTTPPQVMLDGRPDRLSPGARIRDTDNSFVMSGNVVGQRLVVNFVRDASHLIHEVWLLTPEEAAQKANLATPYRNFNFESEGNQPARDDGKTPFHLLPKFPQR
jgi:hypothetical protein